MYCEVCTITKQKSSLFYPGTSRIKKSVLVDHAKTRAHIDAVSKQSRHSCDTDDGENGLLNLFKAILFLAREDVALHKLNSLCSLICTCGADMVTAYRNAHSSSEMLACLTKVHLDALLQSVHGSGYFSILIDELTDVSLSKQLCM